MYAFTIISASFSTFKYFERIFPFKRKLGWLYFFYKKYYHRNIHAENNMIREAVSLKYAYV